MKEYLETSEGLKGREKGRETTGVLAAHTHMLKFVLSKKLKKIFIFFSSTICGHVIVVLLLCCVVALKNYVLLDHLLYFLLSFW